MSRPVFLHYEQSELDAEYDNSAKVPEYAEYSDRYIARSEATRRDLPGRRDVAYGSHPAQHLDIFPAELPGSSAAQIFIHGGYWTRRSKEDFSFVANGLRPHGITTIVIDYALIPMVAMATQVEHCRDAVAWVFRHADELGVDPERIFVSGHSAGGHLATMMATIDWRDHLGLPAGASPIAGVCGLSGLYDLEPIRLCYLNKELKLSVETARLLSPVRNERRIDAPVLLTVGELEGPEYLRQTNMLADIWNDASSEEVMSSTITTLDLVKNDSAVHTNVLDAAHHFSIVDQLNDPGSAMTEALVHQMSQEDRG